MSNYSIESLFEKACELPADQWESFLHQQCMDAVTVEEVLILLRHADEAEGSGFLDYPPGLRPKDPADISEPLQADRESRSTADYSTIDPGGDDEPGDEAVDFPAPASRWPSGRIPKSSADFEWCLVASGIMSLGAVRKFLEGIPVQSRPTDARGLAVSLVRAKRLTRFQATCILKGRPQNLLIGDYEILDRLGKGGMGVVFRARHRVMHRLVALKTLTRETMQSKRMVKRFFREVKAAAQLVHLNIVTAFDAGKQNGVHYLVMELVDGKDLAALLKEQTQFPVAQAIDCILQASRGLQFAHGMGIIHRDIKPSNLLVDNQGVVRILDMGLASISRHQDFGEQSEQLTQDNQMMGTVGYMSPEQAEDPHLADHRADIYALGCTLFKLVTGRPIYSTDSMTANLIAHRLHDIPCMSDHCNEQVPRRLEDVFRKMVAKLPDDRHQSASDLIADLESCIAEADHAVPLSVDDAQDDKLSLFLRQLSVDQLNDSTPLISPIEEPVIEEQEISAGLPADEQSAEIEFFYEDDPPAAKSSRGVWVSILGVIATAGLLFGAAALVPVLWRDNTKGGSASETDGVTGTRPKTLTMAVEPGDRWSSNGLNIAFRWCPPGSFSMGSSTGARTQVTLTKGFWLSETEVTQELFRDVMGNEPWKNRGYVKEDTAFAATYVSWDDAIKFCAALTELERSAGRITATQSYRLPTQAEWEYACRAGTTTAFNFGDSEASLGEYAWFEENAYNSDEKYARQVRAKKPNKWGLYDMHGNVWEWCLDWDWEGENLNSSVTDPIGPITGVKRVFRGGSWYDDARLARSAYRSSGVPQIQTSYIGFRVAFGPSLNPALEN